MNNSTIATVGLQWVYTVARGHKGHIEYKLRLPPKPLGLICQQSGVTVLVGVIATDQQEETMRRQRCQEGVARKLEAEKGRQA